MNLKTHVKSLSYGHVLDYIHVSAAFHMAAIAASMQEYEGWPGSLSNDNQPVSLLLNRAIYSMFQE
jgi:hypothetical protein